MIMNKELTVDGKDEVSHPYRNLTDRYKKMVVYENV